MYKQNAYDLFCGQRELKGQENPYAIASVTELMLKRMCQFIYQTKESKRDFHYTICFCPTSSLESNNL